MADNTIVEHLAEQIAWSHATFGPGQRTDGLIDHIHKEIQEVLDAPNDLEEWIDLVILACDGAWRCLDRDGNVNPSARAETVKDALRAKLLKNKQRKWPDWRTSDPNKAIEHVRSIDT